MMIVISISYHFCAPDARAFYKFFDKDGKVISLNAPRPSSEDIIEYIDKHLAE